MAREHAAGLNARIRALNLRWREKRSVARLGVKRWTFGGPTSESEYGSAAIRVLWLLKDTNEALKEDSLPTLLRYLAKDDSRLGRPYGMWKVVARATKEITAQQAESLSEILRTIAVVNVKKTPGKGQARWPQLRIWAEATAGLLREEIAILAPDIVVAGGTFSLVRRYVLSDVADVCHDTYCRRVHLRDLCPTTKEADKGICILDSYHPAARGKYAKTLLRDAGNWGRGCRCAWTRR
jgi:hypothetical protein